MLTFASLRLREACAHTPRSVYVNDTRIAHCMLDAASYVAQCRRVVAESLTQPGLHQPRGCGGALLGCGDAALETRLPAMSQFDADSHHVNMHFLRSNWCSEEGFAWQAQREAALGLVKWCVRV